MNLQTQRHLLELLVPLHSVAINAVELLHCKRMWWIIFQVRVRHPLSGISVDVATLLTSLTTLSAHLFLWSLLHG